MTNHIYLDISNMTDDAAPAQREEPPLRVQLVAEEDESFRDRLTTMLASDDLAGMTIILRGGKEIEIGGRKPNPHGYPASVRVGKDYIEINIAPAAGIPLFEIVRFSEISFVQYF
jgi:hypothetical protein